ncbi:hypothetical protein N7457_006281 [Penicillium paradoxum]|uniref:uncharacterized protein n=1 Tax=Penicillium paradoxum TaxID=176176 RepID=UPI0025495CE8|nr:uncharacterized protein N7457_006281 [Penicillium paradoxum]KAJ5781121.1 hypothetical protein N7457_006281 [Penicillium paradoxum]
MAGDDEGGLKLTYRTIPRMTNVSAAQGKPPLEPAIGCAQFHHPSLFLLHKPPRFFSVGSFLQFCVVSVFVLRSCKQVML